ncbi:hypothetical protein J6590_058967 [Homalodisca vitripennis]|nr:hypothetical protein J6590_058967 [Homalodisca vitripennis]
MLTQSTACGNPNNRPVAPSAISLQYTGGYVEYGERRLYILDLQHNVSRANLCDAHYGIGTKQVPPVSHYRYNTLSMERGDCIILDLQHNVSRANLCDAHSIYGMRQPKQPSRCPSMERGDCIVLDLQHNVSRANLCDAHSIYGMRQPKQPSRCPVSHYRYNTLVAM